MCVSAKGLPKTVNTNGFFVAAEFALVAVDRVRRRAEVALVPHNGGDALFSGPIRFGRSTDPLALVDDLGELVARCTEALRFDDFAHGRQVGAAHHQRCGAEDFFLQLGMAAKHRRQTDISSRSPRA